MRRMAAERPPLILSKIHFAGWPYSTLLPGPWAAADGLCWHTSRESHPSEDLSELPPLLDPGFTRGCGWTGVSLSDCRRGSGWIKPATMRDRLLYGRMGTALHLPWPSLMRSPAQVVLAHPPASLRPTSRRASRQRTYPAAGYEVLKGQAGALKNPLTLYRHLSLIHI